MVDFEDMLSRRKKVALVGCVLLFLAFTVPGLWDTLVLDELQFYGSAQHILTSGTPEFYYDEIRPNFFFFWHPPLYLYTLATSLGIFGVSEFSARALSLLFSVGTLLMVYLLSSHLFRESSRKETLSLLSVLFFALSPLAIQSATLVDIDGSILTFLMMVFLYVYMKRTPLGAFSVNIQLTLLLFLILWSKLQGFVLLVGAIGAYHLFTGNIKKKLIPFAAISIVATALFLLTWFAYGAFVDAPTTDTLLYTISAGNEDTVDQRVSLVKKALEILWSIKNTIFWFTPTIIILIVIACWARLQQWMKTRQLHDLDVLLFYSLAIIGVLTLVKQQAYGFPKYFIPVVPTLSIVCASLFEHISLPKRKHTVALFGLIALVLAIVSIVFVHDPFISHNFFYHSDISPSENIPFYVQQMAVGSLLYAIPLIIGFSILLLFRFSLSRILMPGLLLVFVITALHIGVVQLTSSYSTTYYYGQEGLSDAVNYLQDNLDSSDVLIARDDIGYYSGQPFYLPFTLSEPQMTRPVSVVVLSPKDRIRPYSSTSFEFQGHTFTQEQQFGHFKIFTIQR